ncbi:MAG: hypothetical protein ORN98_02040 [Alphaproteobacteria bacterium]|nr:hypothetical protein [Alphaproteobacteria bacterium]
MFIWDKIERLVRYLIRASRLKIVSVKKELDIMPLTDYSFRIIRLVISRFAVVGMLVIGWIKTAGTTTIFEANINFALWFEANRGFAELILGLWGAGSTGWALTERRLRKKSVRLGNIVYADAQPYRFRAKDKVP